MTPHHPTSRAVRPATDHDVPTISNSLSSAFADDPLIMWVLGTRHRTPERLGAVFRAMATTALSRSGHEVHLADDGAAVAVWRDVGCWRSTPGHLLRMMPGIVGSFRWRTGVLLRTHALVERHHPEAPHRYLECLGTRADAQGRGLGASVIGAMLDRCDDDATAVYAESSNPRNLAFYHRHGFVRIGEEIRLRPTAPPIIPIWREPR